MKNKGTLISFVSIAFSIVIASIAAQIIMAVFVAILYLLELTDMAKMVIIVFAICLSIFSGIVCFKHTYKYFRKMFESENLGGKVSDEVRSIDNKVDKPAKISNGHMPGNGV